MTWDKIIVGAGLYGLYAAEQCGARGQRVLVLEKDPGPFMRATYINQARVHMGYHYPRSYSTAIKSAGYFERFCRDYGFCLLTEFDQVYATSAHFSWTNAEQFRKFCAAAHIRCDDVSPEKYFNPGQCDGAFLTTEYTYDAQILKKHFLEKLAALPNVTIAYSHKPESVQRAGSVWQVRAGDITAEAPFLLNATYAGVNELHAMLGFEPFAIKYELCEIILCTVDERLKNTGVTVMDGPFFSLMPFGRTGLHSLTSVTFTPHVTSYDSLPTFACQARSGGCCRPGDLANCDSCPARPESAWPMMSQLARKYLREEYGFAYSHSLFSMKPILKASEIDDSRPTVIRQYTADPAFVSVLSGKINTVYDLDEVLRYGEE
ncbi:FAD-binding oxidoreductase [Gemmiger formicilis]|uniref:FAD-dependent oxidoreductase n=1 Tax=Gemmiger formicilis TaxID=745368 RepID=UPI0019579BF8|nr:FAD-dependent oxidoreductase [Gemmiger formicilis]MBM6914579.1 FAD-binding oxidoreductase [Gemmiger formicilis]